jgi:hypothetical protein
VLGAAGLYVKPSKGRGARKTRVTATDLTNFLLGQSSDQTSDAAEVVTALRQMKFRGIEAPYFGDGDFGDIFDLMLEGLPGGAAHSPSAEPRYLPHEIQISTRPYEATLIWRSAEAPGSFLRMNRYAPDWPEHSHYIFRRTFISSKLIEFAREFLNQDETASTSLAGYGILGFDLSLKVKATAKPAAMVSNCPQPALIVLGPGGL